MVAASDRFKLRGFSLFWTLVTLCDIFSHASPATARTWHVFHDGSGDAPGIQAGIDSAVSADTILVGPGTYLENLNFKGKNVVVTSQNGPDQTTIDGSGTPASCVIFRNGEARAARLEGFTLTGGVGSPPIPDTGGFGGGVLIVEAEPSIVGNVITGNQSFFMAGPRETGEGGGIFCYDRSLSKCWLPLILMNEIRDNLAGSNGGGICAAGNMAPEIVDNVIVENMAMYGDGAGVCIRGYAGSPRILGNTIERNIAGDHGGGCYFGGIGILLQGECAWNIIANNTANAEAQFGYTGGGIWTLSTDFWIHHNTIVVNTANGADSTMGGGISVEELGSPLIEANIIAFSTNGGSIAVDSEATPFIKNNLFWNNSGGEGVWIGSEGNIEADPQFCDLNGDSFGLAASSPALSHPAGPLGAVTESGCGGVYTKRATWGSIKGRYR